MLPMEVRLLKTPLPSHPCHLGGTANEEGVEASRLGSSLPLGPASPPTIVGTLANQASKLDLGKAHAATTKWIAQKLRPVFALV